MINLKENNTVFRSHKNSKYTTPENLKSKNNSPQTKCISPSP